MCIRDRDGEQLCDIQRLHFEQFVQSRNRQYEIDQKEACEKGSEEIAVVEKALFKQNRRLRLAVESVKQSGDAQRSEGHGTSQQRTFAVISQTESHDGNRRNTQALDSHSAEEILRQNRFVQRTRFFRCV